MLSASWNKAFPFLFIVKYLIPIIWICWHLIEIFFKYENYFKSKNIMASQKKDSRKERKKCLFNYAINKFLFYGYMVMYYRKEGKKCFIYNTLKEGNVLFNDALNTFYLRLYGFRHMVKNHSDRERGNPLLPHRLLFSISSKGSFICIIPQTG